MKKLLILILMALLIGCQNSNTKPSASSGPTPLLPSATPVPSTYEILADSGAVLEDPSGKILVIPENAFVDENGNPISGKVKVEFTVVENSAQLLMAGFTSNTDTKEGVGLETVFRVGAEQDGKVLALAEGKSLSYFGSDGNYLFYGDSKDGKVIWKDKVEPEKFLTTVPLSELDFTPKGLEPTIEKYLPFKGYNQMSISLRDSLYYSLAARYKIEYNTYISESDDFIAKDSGGIRCGINPAHIKALRDPKFENTLVATKEFEERVQALHKSGRKNLLDVYLKNLDFHLWKLDSMAALQAPDCSKETFLKFAEQKKGRVEKRINSKKYFQHLAKKRKELENEISRLEKNYQKGVKADRVRLETLNKEYRKTLQKRQEYRIEKLTQLGWCLEGPCYPVGVFSFRINKKYNYEKVYSYLVLPEIKSIWALENREDVFKDDNLFGYMEGMEIWAVVVAKNGEQLYYGKKIFRGTSNILVDMDLTPITKEELLKELSFSQDYKKFNNILVDIEMREEIQKQNKKVKENERIEQMMVELTNIIYFCECCGSGDAVKGKELFEANCSACHSIGKDNVGPDLAFVHERMNKEYFGRFVRNSQKVIRIDRDPYAIALYKKYNMTEMTAFPTFTDCELESILKYIESESKRKE